MKITNIRGIQNIKMKIDQNLFFNLLAIISLFIVLVSISMKNMLPDVVKFSNFMKFILTALDIVASIAAVYLWFVVVVKNKEHINFREILKLLVLFLSYTIFHLFLWATYNLNNPNFRFDLSFFTNNILNFNHVLFLIIVALLITLTLIFSKIFGKARLANAFAFIPETNISKENLYLFFLASLAFLDSFTLRFIWNIGFGRINPLNPNDLYQLTHNTPEPIFSSSDFPLWLSYNFFIFFVILLLSVFTVKGVTLFSKNKTGFSLIFMSSLILAFIFNYFIQAGMVDLMLFSEPNHDYVIAGATFFQVLILTIIFLLIYLLINRYIFATGLIFIVFSSFAIGNYIKIQTRLAPIYISELSWVTNPLTLLSFVNLNILLIMGASTIVLIFLIFFLSRFFFKGKLTSWKVRLSSVIVILGVFAILSQIFINFTDHSKQIKIPLLTNYISRISNIDTQWRGAPYVAIMKSLSFVWMQQAFGPIMEEPPDYSKERVEEIAKKYSELASTINETRTENIADQTVIYILSESFANPNHIPGVTISENPIPNIDAIINSSTGGLMFSNDYGGGTGNMEVQSLTGLPMANYTDNVQIINFDVIPRMPFIPSISNFFSDRIALHPENASNYNRNIVYDQLDFNNFYALSNTSADDILENQERLNDGYYVTDNQVYQNILSKINPEKSQFFSVITMQNHLPFLPYPEYDDSFNISASGEGYTDTYNYYLQNYIYRLSLTDRVTQNFLDQLKEIDKKITVVFYGDHLPAIYPNTTEIFKDDPFKQYETDYFIWTNQGNAKNEQVNVNSAEFTPKLLETTNSKVSPYYALLSQVMWTLPSQYNSVLDMTIELDETQTKILNDLKIIQYDLTVGRHYLSENDPFFKIE